MLHPSTQNPNERKAGFWLMTEAYRHDKNAKLERSIASR